MRFTRYSVALLTAGALAATACKTDLTGLNTNPNDPKDAPATVLFNASADEAQTSEIATATAGSFWSHG